MTSLGTDKELLRADFKCVTGKPFKYFFCPILHVDEDIRLCKGHIIPKGLSGKSKVLQRTDVDNGFGSFFESEAVDAIEYGFVRGNLLDIVLCGDPEEVKKMGRRFKLRVVTEGMPKPTDVIHRKEGNKVEFFVNNDDLKEALRTSDKTAKLSGQLAVELDARSSILATSLKASHLCWFQKCGYRYVLSNEGIFVAWVLRGFYERFIYPRRRSNRRKGSLVSDQVKAEVNDYSFQFANFIRPLPSPVLSKLPDEIQQGTLDSDWFFVLWDRDQIYGRISVVKFRSIHFGVMTPVITDARGWALFDLAANLELEFSFAKWNSENREFEVAPSTGQRLVWPSAKEIAPSMPPIPIRQAADIVIQSGRMTQPN